MGELGKITPDNKGRKLLMVVEEDEDAKNDSNVTFRQMVDGKLSGKNNTEKIRL